MQGGCHSVVQTQAELLCFEPVLANSRTTISRTTTPAWNITTAPIWRWRPDLSTPLYPSLRQCVANPWASIPSTHHAQPQQVRHVERQVLHESTALW